MCVCADQYVRWSACVKSVTHPALHPTHAHTTQPNMFFAAGEASVCLRACICKRKTSGRDRERAIGRDKRDSERETEMEKGRDTETKTAEREMAERERAECTSITGAPSCRDVSASARSTTESLPAVDFTAFFDIFDENWRSYSVLPLFYRHVQEEGVVGLCRS